jgi:hypothetical protein
VLFLHHKMSEKADFETGQLDEGKKHFLFSFPFSNSSSFLVNMEETRTTRDHNPGATWQGRCWPSTSFQGRHPVGRFV